MFSLLVDSLFLLLSIVLAEIEIRLLDNSKKYIIFYLNILERLDRKSNRSRFLIRVSLKSRITICASVVFLVWPKRISLTFKKQQQQQQQVLTSQLIIEPDADKKTVKLQTPLHITLDLCIVKISILYIALWLHKFQ